MLLFEKVSNRVGSYIAESLHMDKDKQAVISYGAYLLLDAVLGIVMVMLLGAVFGVFFEALLFSCTTAFLRKYSGGAHSTTSFRCATIGGVVATLVALILKSSSRWLIAPHIMIYLIVTFSVSYFIILKLAPKDSPSKPIVKEEKIKLLKDKSIWTLHFYAIICLGILALTFYIKMPRSFEYIALICSGTLWQSFTLTSLGHKTIELMEAPFRYIKSTGGENQ